MQIKVNALFLLLYISIKLTPFGNNVNNIKSEGGFSFDKKGRNKWGEYCEASYIIK